MDNAALQDAIRSMNRQKISDEVHVAAKSALDAAAAITTETPTVLLKDIRRCIIEHSELIREQMSFDADARQRYEERAEERHTELIATLQQMSVPTTHTSATYSRSASRASIDSTSTMTDKRVFYHYNEKISTGPRIVAAILMYIDSVLKDSSDVINFNDTDAVVMELKDWSSAVTVVAASTSCVTNNREKLSLPKLSNYETSIALEIVCSTVPGRTNPAVVEKIYDFHTRCPGIAGIVEEIRQRLVKCPGIIPDGRRRRLFAMKYPYTTRDKELNIEYSQDGFLKASTLVTDAVQKFSHKSKEAYVAEVLREGNKPIVAVNKVKSSS